MRTLQPILRAALALATTLPFVALLFGTPLAASAQTVIQQDGPVDAVVLPIVTGWYEGRPALYISTETSNRQLAEMTHITYSPTLANAIAGNAVDDIYMVTNFKQGNVIPEAPVPEGPENRHRHYTPLWQLNLVTWKPHSHPHTLRSEDEILAAQKRGNVTISKTNIVINCPIIYTPEGGLFPGAKLKH